MAAPEEGPEPLRYQVSSSHLTVQSSNLHAWAFSEADSWVLTVLVVSLADSGLEGEHTLRGLQEEGQEGAAQHRRYVLFSFSEPSSSLFSESDWEDLKNEEKSELAFCFVFFFVFGVLCAYVSEIMIAGSCVFTKASLPCLL